MQHFTFYGATPKYSDAIERDMKQFYDSLFEKDRRAYAAVEVAKLGYGGIEYIAQVLDCGPKTIGHGRRGLDHSPTLPPGKVRHPGGGRKKITALQSSLEEAFIKVLNNSYRGGSDAHQSPVDPPYPPKDCQSFD